MQTSHWVVRYRVKPDRVDQVRAAMVEFVEQVEKHERQLPIYHCLLEPDGTTFVHYFVVESDAALQFHRNTKHFRRFFRIVSSAAADEPIFTPMRLVAGALDRIATI
jgi:quinol monooxygenase YgiN